jgi:superfamily I DNA/RNA helicase
MRQRLEDGDLVLCRINAPLVPIAYSLIKRGKKAVIRGRDIGSGLLSLIDKLQPTNIPDLMRKIGEYRWKESERLSAAKKDAAVTALHDKCDTLEALTEGISDLSELRARIKSIFDDDAKTGIILSSIHRAKGDEANRVWIIHPELIPHPRAKQDWEIAQERNLAYVAITRAKEELIWVN